MWENAAGPLVTGMLPHPTLDFLGKIFLVEDEVLEVGRMGVIVGISHTLKAFEHDSIPNIRSDDASRQIPPELPLSGKW